MSKRDTTMDPLWSPAQAAEYLNVSVVTVRRLMRARELAKVKVGSTTRVPHSSVLDYIARHTVGGAK